MANSSSSDSTGSGPADEQDNSWGWLRDKLGEASDWMDDKFPDPKEGRYTGEAPKGYVPPEDRPWQ